MDTVLIGGVCYEQVPVTELRLFFDWENSTPRAYYSRMFPENRGMMVYAHGEVLDPQTLRPFTGSMNDFALMQDLMINFGVPLYLLVLRR